MNHNPRWTCSLSLSGLCLLLGACSISTPGPISGLHSDHTHRTLSKGQMSTQIESSADYMIPDKKEQSARISQSFGFGNNQQIDLMAETGILWIDTLHGSEVPEIDEDGYYFGVQYKFSRPGSREEPVLLSAGFAGLGAGAYGDWVKFMDMHGGASVGLNNRYANPYVSGSVGFSLPYSRRQFSYEKTNISGDGPSEIGRYRFASSFWMGYELGLESPFGNRETGVRLHYSMGHKWFHMLEKDDIADHGRAIAMEGIEVQVKLGLSWTY